MEGKTGWGGAQKHRGQTQSELLHMTHIKKTKGKIPFRSIPFSFPLIREGRGGVAAFSSPKGLRVFLGPNPVYSMGEGPE